MKIEIVAALVATGFGLGGTALFAQIEESQKTKESIVRLSTAAENISEQLVHMREEMKADRKMVIEMMIDHNARLKVLESRR